MQAVNYDENPVMLPAYEVRKLKGMAKREYVRFVEEKDKEGKVVSKRIERYTKEVDAGYMVYFPKGHSIRVWTDKDLKALGFAAPAPIVDMQTGDKYDPDNVPSALRRIVASKTKHRGTQVPVDAEVT